VLPAVVEKSPFRGMGARLGGANGDTALVSSMRQ
jgi:hypothetical protein